MILRVAGIVTLLCYSVRYQVFISQPRVVELKTQKFALLLVDRMAGSFRRSAEVSLGSELERQRSGSLGDLLPSVFGGTTSYMTRCCEWGRESTRRRFYGVEKTPSFLPPPQEVNAHRDVVVVIVVVVVVVREHRRQQCQWRRQGRLALDGIPLQARQVRPAVHDSREVLQG